MFHLQYEENANRPSRKGCSGKYVDLRGKILPEDENDIMGKLIYL